MDVLRADYSRRTHSRSPDTRNSRQVPAGGIPLRGVGDTVVLAGRKERNVRACLDALLLLGPRVVVGRKVRVPELNVILGAAAQGGNDEVSALRRPGEEVASLVRDDFDAGKVALFSVELVQRDVEFRDDTGDVLSVGGVRSGDDGETVAVRFPSERRDVLFVLDNFDGDVQFAHPEDLEVAVRRLVLGLATTAVTVDLDAKVPAFVVPVKLALKHQQQHFEWQR